MRTRRTPVLATALLVALPVLSACSGSAEDDVRAAAAPSSTRWADGDTAAAAGATTDPDAATALLEQTATDLPDAALTAALGEITVEDGSATVGWTATWDLAAAPDWTYPATLSLRESDDEWQVVAEPALVHPELGEGQHLELARTLPERAPITDAAGAPLFIPTEVVNVGVDKAQVTDLPALAAALGAATGIPAGGHHRRRRGRAGGAVRPRDHPAATGLRAHPGPGVRPARGGVPDRDPPARAQRRGSPRRCSAGSGRRPPR